ncbi:MAG: hypothetical protein K8U03_05520 [Planctomycetia bacterium]|nr:hypothetical protein [Planctomycetia bacterium]
MTTKPFRSAATFLFSLLLVSATLAASPVEDVAEHFTHVDRNRDGVASGDEIRGTLWARYDGDKDGAVTQTEFVAGRAYDKRFAETAANPQQAWLVLDWNQDNYLSGTELDGKWERLDADGDGKVQKHEFITARTGPAVAPGPNAPPPNNVAPVPAGEGAKLKSLWGESLATAQKSDLFRFFNLVRVGEGAAFEAGTQWTFQPKQGPFRELVLVKLTESTDKRIVAADLLLAGSFVNNAKTDVFARDIADSFIAQLTPAAHAAATRDLVNELEHGAPNTVRVDGAAVPKLPDPPTAAYQAYLGKRESHEQELGDVKLIIRSAPAADEWLLISFQPAREAAM